MTSYLHLNEFRQLELCDSSCLFNNNLNGSVIISVADHDIYEFRSIIAESFHKYQCELVILSIDPFCLSEYHFERFLNFDLPLGIILCDTHHGNQPLTRVLKFCKISNANAVLLRFNQRHEVFFRSIGLWAGTTVISPDLQTLILNTLYNEPIGLLEFIGSFDFSQFDLTKYFHNDHKLNRGVFIGSTKSVHPLRLSALNHWKNLIDIRKTNNPFDMIDLMSQYRWALNLPLNGDFNRRFIECMMANVIIVSERLPISQLIYPFSYLCSDMIFYDFNSLSTDHVLELIDNNPVRTPPFVKLIKIIASGHDAVVLRDFYQNILNRKRNFYNHQFERILECVKLYEIFLSFNQSPDSFSLSQNQLNYIPQLQCLFDLEDEFGRLSI